MGGTSFSYFTKSGKAVQAKKINLHLRLQVKTFISLQRMFPLNKQDQTAECLNLRLNKCSVHQLATNAMLQLYMEIQMSNIPPAYSNMFHRSLPGD